MRADFVVNDAVNHTSSIHTGQSNIDFILTVLGIICDTRRRNLSSLKVDTQHVLEFKFINIVLEEFLRLFLAHYLSFRFKIRRLATKLLNEAI